MQLDWHLIDSNGRVDLEAWRFRYKCHLAVGTCDCGGSLLVDAYTPDLVHGVEWLEMCCERCGKFGALPASRQPRKAPQPA